MSTQISRLGGVLVWYGRQRAREIWAWVGAIGVLAFSVLFLFGAGGILIPAALLLVGAIIAGRLVGTS